MDNPKVKWAVGLVAVLALAAATYFGVKLPTQEYAEPPAGASTQLYDVTVQNDLAVGGDLAVTGALNATGALAPAGGLTGPLTLTGPTAVATATPALILNNTGAGNVTLSVRDSATPVVEVLNGGNTTFGGGYGDTGCTISAAGVLQCNGAATFDGGIGYLVPVLTKDADYLVTTADTGSMIKSTAAVSATFTLPGAAAGLNYCIFNYSGADVVIAFTDSNDVALNEVNSPGDTITNTTAYDSICLTAIDTTNWATGASIGTWADGN